MITEFAVAKFSADHLNFIILKFMLEYFNLYVWHFYVYFFSISISSYFFSFSHLPPVVLIHPVVAAIKSKTF